ncbi:MAG: Nif3-like dinuclear metal center hexameric protein [Sediminibacterium sp.]|nr:Nif3-like dinuclear metal center hexameric protein [Sediminibacterium sp.]
MIIHEILQALENLASFSLQEDYDNSGLIIGSPNNSVTGIYFTLDLTEDVLTEAENLNCNTIINHHPYIFHPIKKLHSSNKYDNVIYQAIKRDFNIIAIHTNLDNVLHGVNKTIADKLNLSQRKVLSPLKKQLYLLQFYVPVSHSEIILEALFKAGAGEIGNYKECGFNIVGQGFFKATEAATPFIGEIGKRHFKDEAKIEVVFEQFKKDQILHALHQHHPYETISYQILTTENTLYNIGSGLVGYLKEPLLPTAFLDFLSDSMQLHVFKYNLCSNKPIHKVAICGGAGSSLIPLAEKAQAQAFISADFRYNDFFKATNELALFDIGHYESEFLTENLVFDYIKEKFPNFANLKRGLSTNPVSYFVKN